MKIDFVALHELIYNDPLLRKGMLGLLVAILIDALEALKDNKDGSHIKLALEFIDEGNDLFVALAHELEIEPCFLKKKILDDIGINKL